MQRTLHRKLIGPKAHRQLLAFLGEHLPHFTPPTSATAWRKQIPTLRAQVLDLFFRGHPARVSSRNSRKSTGATASRPVPATPSASCATRASSRPLGPGPGCSTSLTSSGKRPPPSSTPTATTPAARPWTTNRPAASTSPSAGCWRSTPNFWGWANCARTSTTTASPTSTCAASPASACSIS